MALEAKAEERLTRGFISMTTATVLGLMENCTFEPPVSTPIAQHSQGSWRCA